MMLNLEWISPSEKKYPLVKDFIEIKADQQLVGEAGLYEYSEPVSSAKPNEKFYFLYIIKIEKSFQKKGYGIRAFEKICRYYIERGYSIYLHDLTMPGIGPKFYKHSRLTTQFEVVEEEKKDGIWYLIRKKAQSE